MWAWSHLVGVFEFEAGDDLTLQLAVLAGLAQDRLAELWDVGATGLPEHRVQPVVWRMNRKWRRRRSVGEVNVNFRLGCVLLLCVFTCVLGDLPLGDHLFTLGIHQLAVFVLLQTLENVSGVGLSAEPLQERVCHSVENLQIHNKTSSSSSP